MKVLSKELETLKKYRIGILAGGFSSEREISLKSGKAVFTALESKGLETVFLDVKKEDDFFSLIENIGIELAFIALHGKFGEDGTIQRLLSEKGILYTGSDSESSALALDKLLAKKRFESEDVLTPEYYVVGTKDPAAMTDFTYPCVVKPRYEGSSIGLSVVGSSDYLLPALNKAGKYGQEAIVEKFIPGREITVGVLCEEALPVIEIVAPGGTYDFDAKYYSARTKYIVPAVLTGDCYKRSQEIALKAHKVLGCGNFSRVDLRIDESENIFVLEINTIPGLTERSLFPMAAAAVGMSFFELCIKMLYGAIKVPTLKSRCGFIYRGRKSGKKK